MTVNGEQFAELSAKWGEQAELLRFINRLGVVGVASISKAPPSMPPAVPTSAPTGLCTWS